MEDKVIIPERVKPDFQQYFIDTYYPNATWKYERESWLFTFSGLPFDMQSGVYIAFLRSKGIDLEYSHYFNRKCPHIFSSCAFSETIKGTDYNTALTTALNEAFKLLEEQLKEKV